MFQKTIDLPGNHPEVCCPGTSSFDDTYYELNRFNQNKNQHEKATLQERRRLARVSDGDIEINIQFTGVSTADLPTQSRRTAR
ncbi:hypothetical protein N8639_01490 [bacterium]|nr:hypothetical protein [bacterium]